MIDLKNISYQPSIQEISEYIENDLFDRFYQYMNEEYQALCKVEYSKDSWFPGWNIKLRKAGKALCAIYPRKNYFIVLVVVGKKEKESVESLLPECSEEIRRIYQETKEGNGQRWLMIDVSRDDEVYRDVRKLIRIRRESR